MKPLLLELQAFGPFVEKQTVDFEKLSENGIFLIKGETGSGKTTIFDAMTFALYGGGSGTDEKSKVGRNNFENWRCEQAPDNMETFISFVFSSNGRKYKFTRKLVPKRVNLSAEYEAGEIDENGNVIPFFNNPKAAELKAKAEEIIGLTKEQFRQVVLLPQGQFEKFLTASSDEKTEILNKIFNADMWKKYAEKFFNSAASKEKLLKDEKKSVDNSLGEEDVSNIEELKQKTADLTEKLTDCIAEHKKFTYDKKQEKLNEDRTLFEQFKPLHELLKEKEELEQQAYEIEKQNNRYNTAKKAEEIRPFITDFENAKKDFDKRSKTLRELKDSEASKKEAAETAAKLVKEHNENSPIEELNKKIGKYEDKKDGYSSIDDLRGKMNVAKEKLEGSKKELDAAQGDFEKKTAEAIKAKKQFDEADRIAGDYRDRYYSGIYGEIANDLKDGEVCPICGSTSHPKLAEKLPDSVTKAELDEKEKAAKTAKDYWDRADESRKTAEQKRDEKQSNYNTDKENFTKAETEYNNASENLIDGIADTAALENAIAELKAKIDKYTDDGKELQQKSDAAKTAFEKLQADIENATQEEKNAGTAYKDVQDKLNSALKDGGYPDIESVKSLLLNADERKKLSDEITAYKTKCETNKEKLTAQQKELEGKTEPDNSKFDERQEEIKNEADNFNQTSTRLDTEIKRLTEKYTKLSKTLAHYDSEIRTAEADLAFAKKLRGDTGVGIQRYILAIMFNQVIGKANEMLGKIHGGRYMLYRSDDKGSGNKRGLELKVHDSRSPEKEGRDVSSLSGGEKFLVSLALSIGMSTVAQKSGVRIEALFIDEGFGTLDYSSISDAMDVLDYVRKSNSTIGIISHVQLLEENIPTQIEVIKADSGNSIKIV